MSWQLVREFLLTDDWQYSQPIDGTFFRLRPINPPLQARMTAAQASTTPSVELFDAQKLITPVAHILEFEKPPFFQERRIALRKNPLSPPWRVRLEVSTLPTPSPAPSPTPTPPPAGQEAVTVRELLSVSTGQQQFVLSSTPANPELSELYLNGVKATFGSEYTINGSLLTWLMPLTLQQGDEFEIYYLGQTGQQQSGIVRELLSVSTGQQQFVLGSTPANPELSELYLNGVKATFGSEYVINGSLLIWLMPLALQQGDEFEIYYRS